MAKGIKRLFGEELRARRLERKLSQEILAELAGLSRNEVGLVERGEGNPTFDSLIALADAVKDSLVDMLVRAHQRAG